MNSIDPVIVCNGAGLSTIIENFKISWYVCVCPAQRMHDQGLTSKEIFCNKGGINCLSGKILFGSVVITCRILSEASLLRYRCFLKKEFFTMKLSKKLYDMVRPLKT